MDWSDVNKKGLAHLSEKQVEDIMRAEQRGKARAALLLRLYGRFAKLRKEREMHQIFGESVTPRRR